MMSFEELWRSIGRRARRLGFRAMRVLTASFSLESAQAGFTAARFVPRLQRKRRTFGTFPPRLLQQRLVLGRVCVVVPNVRLELRLGWELQAPSPELCA